MSLEQCYVWLCWLGFIYIIRLVIFTLYEIYFSIKVHVIPKIFPTADLTKYGEWAVVLGAEDEIVGYYVEELAAKGMKILLISRTLSKISKTAKHIESTYNTKTKCLAVDFRKEKEIHDIFGKNIKGIDIGILVCGVDNRREETGKFLDATPEELWGTIDNNMTSIAMAMSLVLSGMVERKRGKIVNISSLFAIEPQPNTTAQESATKAFSMYLSRSSQVELAPHGIEVQTLLPATVLSDPRHPFLFNYPSAKAYAKSAASLIDRCNISTGHWFHGILQHLKACLHRSLWQLIEDAGRQHIKVN